LLSLDTLRGVDEQDHALAGGQRPRHLVAEVDVAGRVDEVNDVVGVVEPDRLELDRDPPLPLELHGVEVLLPHVAGVDRPADLEHAVGQGRLTVVDVGDDRDVADLVEVHRGSKQPTGRLIRGRRRRRSRVDAVGGRPAR
jgi:hypothetical protein